MEQSRIQFYKPILKVLEFVENEIKLQSDSNFDLKINIENKYKKNDDSTAIVILDVKIGEKSDESPFYINIVYSANFRWDEEITNPDDFLNINAPALLYSYIRPIVSSIMANTKYNRLDLPFMDFSKVVKNKI